MKILSHQPLAQYSKGSPEVNRKHPPPPLSLSLPLVQFVSRSNCCGTTRFSNQTGIVFAACGTRRKNEFLYIVSVCVLVFFFATKQIKQWGHKCKTTQPGVTFALLTATLCWTFWCKLLSRGGGDTSLWGWALGNYDMRLSCMWMHNHVLFEVKVFTLKKIWNTFYSEMLFLVAFTCLY